jgi:nitrate reductase NapE component
MIELNNYLVALSQAQSYNSNMNTETLNIILTIGMLLPMMLVPVVGIINFIVTYKQEQKILFGPVHDDQYQNK